MELTDDDLARARTGDRAAQARFVATYQPRVYAVCAALAPTDAADLAQDALLRGLRQLHRFDPDGPARLGTFVLRIARNLCVDRARGARVRMPHDHDIDAIVVDDRADHRLAAAEDAERVRRAVLALPPDQRAAIALRVWGELDYAEVAAIEGVPVGTIRSRLARARDALREALVVDEELADVG